MRINKRRDDFLYRWDLNYKCNYSRVCVSCKFFKHENKKCKNKYNIKDFGTISHRLFSSEKELIIFEPYNYVCDNHEFLKNLELLFNNPFRNYDFKQIIELRKKFENEIDITIRYKSRVKKEKVLIDNIDIYSAKFMKTYFLIKGHQWQPKKNPKDQVHLNLHYLIAQREFVEFREKPNRVLSIMVYKNGDLIKITFDEFKSFMIKKSFKSLFNKEEDVILPLRRRLLELIPSVEYIFKDGKKLKEIPKHKESEFYSTYDVKDLFFDKRTEILFKLDGVRYVKILANLFNKERHHFSGLSEFEYNKLIDDVKERVSRGEL
jgi:hypothetical protein